MVGGTAGAAAATGPSMVGAASAPQAQPQQCPRARPCARCPGPSVRPTQAPCRQSQARARIKPAHTKPRAAARGTGADIGNCAAFSAATVPRPCPRRQRAPAGQIRWCAAAQLQAANPHLMPRPPRSHGHRALGVVMDPQHWERASRPSPARSQAPRVARRARAAPAARRATRTLPPPSLCRWPGAKVGMSGAAPLTLLPSTGPRAETQRAASRGRTTGVTLLRFRPRLPP